MSDNVINYWVLPALADKKIIYRGFAAEVIKAAKSRFGVNVLEKTRKRETCDARQLVCYILRTNTELSTTKIGELLNINHATVLHSVTQTETLLKSDKKYRRKYQPFVDEFKDKLNFFND